MDENKIMEKYPTKKYLLSTFNVNKINTIIPKLSNNFIISLTKKLFSIFLTLKMAVICRIRQTKNQLGTIQAPPPNKTELPLNHPHFKVTIPIITTKKPDCIKIHIYLYAPKIMAV